MATRRRSQADLRLPRGARTANERLFDSMLRHQAGLQNVSARLRRELRTILDGTESRVRMIVREDLRTLRALETPAQARRVERLVRRIQRVRSRAWVQMEARWNEAMREVVLQEPRFLRRAVRAAVGAAVNLVSPRKGILTGILARRPFLGKTLRQWIRGCQGGDLARIATAIRTGLAQGESSAAIARRVVGSVGARGRNGATQVSRRDINFITTTGINHFAQQARRETIRANPGVFGGETFAATLDKRASKTTLGFDGKRFGLDEGPMPPLSGQSRAARIPWLLRNVLGAGRRAEVGGPPDVVGISTWLRRQSAAEQESLLGVTKARLFRRGGLDVADMVDEFGREITLDQLSRTEAAAFESAGLDPSKF